jgi:hypothetical protein
MEIESKLFHEEAGKSSGSEEGFSRREFVKTIGATAAAVALAGSSSLVSAAPPANRHAVIAALGDALIPSDPGDPGYKDLEAYNITEEVLKGLSGVSDADLELFNESTKEKFGGKTFEDLAEAQRAEYLRQISDGGAVTDAKELKVLRKVYRNTRRQVFLLYYSNFPEHQWPRDKDGVPILKPGDLHQITNPNTKQLITAWDQIGFAGPLTWEQEEQHRNFVKKLHWHENWSPLDYQQATDKKG